MSSPLQCAPKIALPEQLAGFFSEQGYTHPVWCENRAVGRIKVRTSIEMQFLHVPRLLQNIVPRNMTARTVGLLKDLSRTGIAILYHEQLYPNETLKIQLWGKTIEFKVIRCRRLGDSCYEIGGTILRCFANEDSQ